MALKFVESEAAGRLEQDILHAVQYEEGIEGRNYLSEEITDLMCSRVCLKIAFRELCVPLCGRFAPDEGGVVGYVD